MVGWPQGNIIKGNFSGRGLQTFGTIYYENQLEAMFGIRNFGCVADILPSILKSYSDGKLVLSF